MDQQYHPNMDPSGRPPRYAQQNSKDYNGMAQQQQTPSGFAYESYQTPTIPSHPQSKTASPTGTPNIRDYTGDGDIAMEDADPYNRMKYPSRPGHAQRPSAQFIPQDDGIVGRRYSPMKTLSPSSPYTASPQQSNHTSYGSYAQNTSARQSPTRSHAFPPTSSQAYYPSPTSTRHQASHLSPLQPAESSPDQYYPQSATAHLNAVFGRETKSPHHLQPPNAGGPVPRGPIPRFKRVKTVQELEPRINPQPAFRRANPEGGFISPLQALTTHLPSTYRICNPTFKYESSRNPRRVLTKPSKGTKNDGYDNEDSDYILYVNDILGNEDNGHKNRYLILDVLGQGTFGQVVKCQNLKTQEVVAVKVVKNRTAYFNQSMMEVSVLDLLNGKLDKNDDHHLLRLKDTFIHRQHLCLVFELLSVNLYELIKQNQFRGLSTTLVRVFAQQLLNGLSLLNKARLIHCDLKPENILLKKYDLACDMVALC